MYFVRKSSPALPEPDLEKRTIALTDDLSRELAKGGVSVFKVEGPELELFAALYSAKSEKPHPFGYYPISEEVLAAHNVEIRPETEDLGSPFAYLRERHYELKRIRDTSAFAREVAREDKRVIPKGRITELVRAERSALTVTSAAEWEATRDWTKPKPSPQS